MPYIVHAITWHLAHPSPPPSFDAVHIRLTARCPVEANGMGHQEGKSWRPETYDATEEHT
jgi:hypothetical protein